MTTAEQHSKSQNLMEDIETKWRQIGERIRNRKPLCPVHNKESEWVRMLGWRGDALYKCPNGDAFSMHGDSAQMVKKA